MVNPLDAIKKLRGRSWDELRTRGGQALSVYTEKIGLKEGAPTDDEFWKLIEPGYFEEEEISLKNLLLLFRERAADKFFLPFASPKASAGAFRRLFPESAAGALINRADNAVAGKFDLLGYQNLNFGTKPDWHLEPLSGKRSPLKHWKEFEELDAAETGDKKIVWELNRHQHFFALGASYWLTGDEIYAKTFFAHIYQWAEDNPPSIGVNWMSSLEVAFRSISWIWGLYFFKDSPHLTAKDLQNVLKYLYVHGKHLEKYLSTYYSPNTHLTGEALGLYYLGTQMPFERSRYWRQLGKEILLDQMNRQILSDGVYFEQSNWYQKYTVDFYTHFYLLHQLNEPKEFSGQREKAGAKLQSMLDYMMQITRPDGATPIVGDDDGGRMLPLDNSADNDFRDCLAIGAVLFERGDLKFAAENFAESSFWLLGTDGAKAFEDLRTKRPVFASKEFRSGGYYVMRDGWEDTDNYMLIDCGPHGALNCGHSHADSLAFELALGGRAMMVDPGTYTYHESEETRDWFRSTPAHNTLTVDNQSSSEPNGKFKWSHIAQAEVKAWVSQERFDFFEGSHNGYLDLPNSPVGHTRGVLFLKNDYFIMRDAAETTGEHTFQQNFHFANGVNPEIEGLANNTWCVTERTKNQPGMRMFVFGDNGQWQNKESWVSPCYGKKVNAPYLRFLSEGRGTQEFFTFMLPTDEFDELPLIEEVSLEQGRAFVIRFRGYKDVFVYGEGRGKMIESDFFNSDFRFSWARISEGERLPDEFVLIDGNHLSIDGRDVVKYPKNLGFTAARRLGNKMNVRTSDSVYSIELS
jgi:hypothetical protein